MGVQGQGTDARTEQRPLALWSDDPATVDMLAFDAVAATVADALVDDELDPVALGLSGSWGSGKTTVLGLVNAELERRASDEARTLVIQTDPWRYDPSVGAKETLIGEVLAALTAEIEASDPEPTVKEQALHIARRLAGRVDWAKAIKLTAKTSIAFQLPSVDELLGLVKPAGADHGNDAVHGLEGFRAEFRSLVESAALEHIRGTVVLVDDLDRCLPETVIETLEAIRLFLAVPGMSFVVAADEDRVADAIRTRFQDTGTPLADTEMGEEPAKLYLHKIVQTTIPLPGLSRFDTQAFLLLLQAEHTLTSEQVSGLIGQCSDIRRQGGDLDHLKPIEGHPLTEEMTFASRLTPILYEKLRGNPRRVKRFLNDLRVRGAVAQRRGIELEVAIVAKLMVLEKLLPDEFESLLGWLAQGTLRDQLIALEAAAGRTASPPEPTDGGDIEGEGVKTPEKEAEAPAEAKQGGAGNDAEDNARTGRRRAKAPPSVSAVPRPVSESAPRAFSEPMLRWAKLPPAIAYTDLSPYLYLAAAFAGEPLLDEGLPERLRDVAANLLSSSRRDHLAVSDNDLQALPPEDSKALLEHLGRTIRDQPGLLAQGVTAILRIARQQRDRAGEAASALSMLPAQQLRPGIPLLFSADDPDEVLTCLRRWQRDAQREPVKTAIESILKNTRGA